MVMKVVAVYSTKGGVGKTTAAVNLAWEASQSFRVLLWDLDTQGASSYLLEVKAKVRGGIDSLVSGKLVAGDAIRPTPHPNLDILPADDSYREIELVFDAAKNSTRRIEKVLASLGERYDVVILDCPPGASLVAENAVQAADIVVVPLVPSPLSLRSLDQVAAIVAEAAQPTPVLGFLSMVDRRKAAHRAAAESLHRENTTVSDILVPSTVIVERMGAARAPVATYAPNSEAAQAYEKLWKRVAAIAKVRHPKRKR